VKIGYGIGDFGFNLVVQAAAVHLMFFFTDVYAIPAAAAGTISLVSKIWDAVIDPGLGMLVDRTRTRWGSKRPYLLFGAVPAGAAVFLLFRDTCCRAGRSPTAPYILFCAARRRQHHHRALRVITWTAAPLSLSAWHPWPFSAPWSRPAPPAVDLLPSWPASGWWARLTAWPSW
jgi:hypothetical protein